MSEGGIVKGKSHAEGGEHFTAAPTGKHVELEAEEVVITSNAFNDNKEYTLSGTNFQALDKINRLSGGKPLTKKVTSVSLGDVVICKKSVHNQERRTYKGTIREIVNQVNQSQGCAAISTDEKTAFNDGGKINSKMRKTLSLSKTYNRNSIQQGTESMALGGQISVAQLITENIRTFFPVSELKALLQGLGRNYVGENGTTYSGEEAKHFIEIFKSFDKLISEMPKTYETDDIPEEEKIAYLHYFENGGSDWFILEKDKGDGSDSRQLQAFGYAILNQDFQNAEYGYISIEELKSIPSVQLDLYFKPKKLVDALDKLGHPEYQKEEEIAKPQSGKSANESKDFFYGKEFNISIKDGISLRVSLAGKGFDVIKQSKAYMVIEKNGNEMKIVDRLGGFDLLNYQDDAYITSVQYHMGDGFVEPDYLAKQIEIGFNDFFTVAEPLSINELTIGKSQSEINNMIRMLVKEKGTERIKYSSAELELLTRYEGSGGLAKEGETGARLLDQFFTPDEICKKMWGLALKHGFKFKDADILEPAAGIGRFLKFIPKDLPTMVHTFEIDETSHLIMKVLYNDRVFNHVFDSFEKTFFDGKRHTGLANVPVFYDLVIGNPPYRDYISPYAPLGEKEATGASTFDQYFIMRGIDVLKPKGLLVFIVPSSFMNNGSAYNDFKEKLAAKADLIDGFRLPSGVFPNTEVTTDILVLRKK